jgi:hypothetical protein
LNLLTRPDPLPIPYHPEDGPRPDPEPEPEIPVEIPGQTTIDEAPTVEMIEGTDEPPF